MYREERITYDVCIFYIGQNISILWFDTINKIINRYNPIDTQYGRSAKMDQTIQDHFERLLPAYTYIGNTLERWRHQDYSLLYAIKRIYGLSNTDALSDLIARERLNSQDLNELLLALIDRIYTEF